MAFAVKRTIRLGGQFAMAMRADGGERQQLPVLADHEKSLITKITVNPGGGVVIGWPGIDRMFCVGYGSGAVVPHRLATGGEACGEQQKLSAVEKHGFNTRTQDSSRYPSGHRRGHYY